MATKQAAIKQATYNFIVKDLTDTLESHEGVTMSRMLVDYYNQWLQEPGNNRKGFTSFTYDYVFNYPMIPFENYLIKDFLTSLNISIDDNDDYIDTYIQLVSTVIYDLMQGKEYAYK